MDPEIARLRAAGHKGALTAARDLALFPTMYAWGLRRRDTARLEIQDWRRQAKLPEFGDFAGLAVRWGTALPGQPPRRRMVISVWPGRWPLCGTTSSRSGRCSASTGPTTQ
ncbi:MAG: hypothetical protein L0Y54_23460 [Sporichthyaceae bacterium]|nr:hypothetical protein [Sporichthyaceae bacterium]